jgi:hypothetical protein
VAQTLRQLSDRINLTSRTQSQAWNFHSKVKRSRPNLFMWPELIKTR